MLISRGVVEGGLRVLEAMPHLGVYTSVVEIPHAIREDLVA